MPKKKITENRQVFVYGILQDVAHERLELLEKGVSCRGNAYLDGMLMAALTMEAFFNHLGPHLISCWDEVDRGLSPEGKLKLILDKIHYEPDFGRPPYQTLREMIWFRNKVAHGRTEKYVDQTCTKDCPDRGFPEETLTKWEGMITEKHFRRFIEAMDLIITDLWEHSGITDQSLAPGILGHWGYHGGPPD